MCIIFKNQHPFAPNIPVKVTKAVMNLKQDRSIHTTKAGKGNVTVIWDRKGYKSKVSEHLRDRPNERIQETKVDTSVNNPKAQASRYLSNLKENPR